MPTGREELAHALLLHVAAGTLDAQEAAPALRALVGGAAGSAPSRLSLLQALRAEPLEGLGPVVEALARRRFRDVEAAHALKAAAQPLTPELAAELADLPLDVPLGWRTRRARRHALGRSVRAAAAAPVPRRRGGTAAAARRGRRRSPRRRRRLGDAPSAALWVGTAPSDRRRSRGGRRRRAALAAALERRSAELDREAGAALARADEVLAALPAPLPSDLPESALVSRVPARFRLTADVAARRALLDLGARPGPRRPWCPRCWPSRPSRGRRSARSSCSRCASAACTARTGAPGARGCARRSPRWRASGPSPPPSRRRSSVCSCGSCRTGGGGREVVGVPRSLGAPPSVARPSPRHRGAVEEPPLDGGGERAPRHGRLRRRGRGAASAAAADPGRGGRRARRRPRRVPPLAPAPARPRPEPPAWQRHVQGFFAENWYMVAGVLMVVVGSSLLAYFTWDRNWLLRYTIVPGLLGGLHGRRSAVTASWLEKTDRRFAGTGATLRGAAIALLPANFMAVALLAHDPQVTRKLVAVPAMAAAVPPACSGPRSCAGARAVHPRLGFLGLTLLALDALVLLEPLTRVLAARPAAVQLALAPARGFYARVRCSRLGGACASRASVMDREMALERRVPWFVGAALVITYLEVFTWVHGSLRILPRPTTLRAARDPGRRPRAARGAAVPRPGRAGRARRRVVPRLRPRPGRAPDGRGRSLRARRCASPWPGVVWLYQAAARAQPLHHWIGATLLVLAGAAVGLLPGFPRPWLPAPRPRPGRGGASWWRCGAAPRARCCATCAARCTSPSCSSRRPWPCSRSGTTAAGRSPPRPCLVVIAALFARRARQDQSLRWLHTAMALLALALPYLGFVDMEGRRLQGNTMAFGLALLSWGWIAPRAAAADAASARRPLDRALAVRRAGPGRDGPARDRRARARRRPALDGLLPRIRRGRC